MVFNFCSNLHFLGFSSDCVSFLLPSVAKIEAGKCTTGGDSSEMLL